MTYLRGGRSPASTCTLCCCCLPCSWHLSAPSQAHSNAALYAKTTSTPVVHLTLHSVRLCLRLCFSKTRPSDPTCRSSDLRLRDFPSEPASRHPVFLFVSCQWPLAGALNFLALPIDRASTICLQTTHLPALAADASGRLSAPWTFVRVNPARSLDSREYLRGTAWGVTGDPLF
jgi:hypothetical protein